MVKREILLHKKNLLLGIFIFSIALVGRVFYLIKFSENPFFNYYPRGFDQHLILQSAIEIADGNILGPWSSEKQSAIYKYFLAVPVAIFGKNFYAVWIWQFAWGAITAVLLYLAGQKIFGRTAGIIAGLWYALYGPAIFFEGQALREAFFCFLLVLLTYLLANLETKEAQEENKETNWKLLTAIAMVASFAMQTRPTAVIVFFGVVFYLWFFCLRAMELRDKIKVISFTKIIFILVSLPLLVRAILVSGKFVFYDQSGPFVLLLSNLPDYSGVGWEPSPLYRAFIEQVGGEDALTWKSALTRIVQLWALFPLSVATLYLKKIYFFFNGYEYPSNLNYYLFADYSPLFMMPWSRLSVLSSFGFCGIILGVKDRKIENEKALVYTLFLALLASNLIFYPVDRFRFFHAPFLMLFASYSLVKMGNYIKNRRAKEFVASVIFVSAMIWLLKIPSSFNNLVRPEDYRNLGRTYIENESKRDIKKGEHFLYKAWEEWTKKGAPINPAGEELGKLELFLANEKLREGDYQGVICNIKIAELVWKAEEVETIKAKLTEEGINFEQIQLSSCIQKLQ